MAECLLRVFVLKMIITTRIACLVGIIKVAVLILSAHFRHVQQSLRSLAFVSSVSL